MISQYWKGLTSRELADEHDVTQKTVLAWLTEYTSLLYRFLCRQIQRYTPKLHVDELFLKMKKTFYYLWDSICSDTRFAFWNLFERRTAKSGKSLLDESPRTDLVVTDGAFTYPRIIRERYHGTARHLNCVKFEDKPNNNLIERLQNTLRRFLHPRRGFNSLQTGITQLHGFWIFYNFIRNHTGIGMSPAEKAGLIQPWKTQKTVKTRLQTLIRKATHFWHILYLP